MTKPGRLRRIIFIGLVGLVGLLVPAGLPGVPAGYHAGYAAEVVDLINIARAEAGCPPLTLNTQLSKAAQGHAADMARNDFFSHTGSDNSTFIDRIVAAGYQPWRQAAENVAAGYASPDVVVANWLNSPGHRANILNCTYEDTGVGYYYLAADRGDTNYNHYWTQDFGVLQ